MRKEIKSIYKDISFSVFCYTNRGNGKINRFTINAKKIHCLHMEKSNFSYFIKEHEFYKNIINILKNNSFKEGIKTSFLFTKNHINNMSSFGANSFTNESIFPCRGLYIVNDSSGMVDQFNLTPSQAFLKIKHEESLKEFKNSNDFALRKQHDNFVEWRKQQNEDRIFYGWFFQ